jgi:hypothetical protein
MGNEYRIMNFEFRIVNFEYISFSLQSDLPQAYLWQRTWQSLEKRAWGMGKNVEPNCIRLYAPTQIRGGRHKIEKIIGQTTSPRLSPGYSLPEAGRLLILGGVFCVCSQERRT